MLSLHLIFRKDLCSTSGASPPSSGASKLALHPPSVLMTLYLGMVTHDAPSTLECLHSLIDTSSHTSNPSISQTGRFDWDALLCKMTPHEARSLGTSSVLETRRADVEVSHPPWLVRDGALHGVHCDESW
ncbi:hypothetical protein BDP27DRAFT_1420456 [Rhodocollybia butyracea]|uniref:Uncharacterized protein n=1 Tax=Rhodocollybia butyracea TaxID=206335 RepID=A0A9P5PXN9_9AGAR|nr:hypothetical protein BDP27DRAFT_1420456 [Rhodocollybia butyracea]